MVRTGRPSGRSRGDASGSTPPAQQLLALFAAKDLDSLVDAAFAVLQGTVRCDFASAFYRSSGDGFLKERDSRGRTYGGAFMQRYVQLAPAIPIARANRGIKLIPTKTGLPYSDEHLQQTAFYREVMQPQGWRHAVALCFWGDPPGESPIFVTSVFRESGQIDFSGEDLANLERVHAFLDCAVTRVHERAAGESIRAGVGVALHERTRGLAVLDWNLHLVQANPLARRLCAAWLNMPATADASRAWTLPAPIMNACRELRLEWQRLLRANADAANVVRRRTIKHPIVTELEATITMVSGRSDGLANPTFMLELQRAVAGVKPQPSIAAAPVLRKLTVSERAAAVILAEGLSNQEIADRLGKSVTAVKFLLHRAYQKTGVANRAALVAALQSRTIAVRKEASSTRAARPARPTEDRSRPGGV